MKKHCLAFLLPAVLLSCTMIAEKPSVKQERVNFELTGKAPVVASPEDNVNYKFNISHSSGIKSVCTFLEGAALEGSRSEYPEMPSQVEYAFSYTLNPAQTGQTVDFVVRAECGDGFTDSVDYPVYVRSVSEPEGDVDPPEQTYSKVLYSEIFDTPMKISNTSEADTEAGGVTGNNATEFVPGTIARYNGDDPEYTEGVKYGLTVYSGDVSQVSYSSDGVNMCLSKYKYSSLTAVSGTYVWGRKAAGGWLTASGILLHGCTELMLTFNQCGGSVKVEWSADGENWTEICKGSLTGECSANFTVPEGTESLRLRFSENGGSVHLRFDDISLKGE